MHHELLRLAEAQHGLVRRQQARLLGLSDSSIDRLVTGPHWEPVTGQVIRRVGSAPNRGQRVLAAVLDAGPGARLSHRSAAAWWGVRGSPLEPLQAVRTLRSHRRSPLCDIHVVRDLPDRWVTVLDGVPIVRPELAALHLFASCRELQAERWVETLWSLRLLDGRSLARFLEELGRRGRNGTAGLRRYLRSRGRGYTPAASSLEARVLQILREAGISMRRQVDSGGDTWTGRVDFRHPSLPVILEVQSERHHTALVDTEADARRLRKLRADGFLVVEVTDVEVWTRPWVVLDRVRRALDAARRSA